MSYDSGALILILRVVVLCEKLIKETNSREKISPSSPKQG